MSSKSDKPRPELKPIPKFATEDEERAYWATHSTTEHIDWSKAKVIRDHSGEGPPPRSRFVSDGSDMVFEGDPDYTKVKKRNAAEAEWRRENGPRLLREAEERLAREKAPKS